uniref:Uncharacterized protein n=1 Tax=Caenorhabditis japonica TaxID=281687 RepID=A0A8R1DU10_CAEJA
MKDVIKKEEPDAGFHHEDSYVLGDDSPDTELPELPQILARKRKLTKKLGIGRRKKRKTKRKTTGTKRRKVTRRKKRSTKKSAEGTIKIPRSCRKKEEKLHIRQNDDVVVLDAEDLEEKVPTPPPPAKPTPSNILDQILFAQEKEFGPANPSGSKAKPAVTTSRKGVWSK